MKRLTIGLLVLALLLSTAGSAFAGYYDFTGHLSNEATFETLEDTRAAAPSIFPGLGGIRDTAVYVPHPALDDFPVNTAYVYRSPDMYAGFAAPRMNSTYVVYVDRNFADKAEAFAYVQSLGLIEIVDHVRGSIVLVTPSSGKGVFAAADQKNYYALQTAICAQKGRGTVDDVSVTFADGEYYGTFKHLYLIGIDGGATFLNDYVAGTENFIGRVAGMLLINGQMNPLSKVASLVPVYLVNAKSQIIENYQTANATDAYSVDGDIDIYFNQTFPLRKVIVAEAEELDISAFVADAYDRIFANTMRIQVYKNGYLSAGTPYQNTTGDCAPYSLNHHCDVVDGVTEGGLHVITMRDFETFKDMQTVDSEFLNTWYELIPDAVFNNTAAPGSVPLILGLAGTGDDPLQLTESLGLMALAEEKGIAVVSPGHEGFFDTRSGEDGIEYEVQPALIRYMLDKYPALDASRVYVTGYSRGGRTTLKVVNGAPEMIAAAVPMAANQYIPTEAHTAHLYETKMPIMFLTSTGDMASLFDATTNGIASALVDVLNVFADYNHVEPLKDLDFEEYPIGGFRGDMEFHTLLNGEYSNHRWFKCDADGVPMLGVCVTEGLQHALYPSYAYLAWDFMEHFSRNPETYEITYTP